MERVGGRQEKMEGHCSTGQSPQWAVVPEEEEEEEEEEEKQQQQLISGFPGYQTCGIVLFGQSLSSL